ncbi:hypothetical protein LSM04_004434 [Trypanosoma melophagium]|uniref:uncharacterized protein n=1 Tax=Trypanosoma melophagium TaxID=715481 RepID=UPI00351A9A9D|nr:hypothetical protein LSM04_004434 [Trypanosoma melophagium]
MFRRISSAEHILEVFPDLREFRFLLPVEALLDFLIFRLFDPDLDLLLDLDLDLPRDLDLDFLLNLEFGRLLGVDLDVLVDLCLAFSELRPLREPRGGL